MQNIRGMTLVITMQSDAIKIPCILLLITLKLSKKKALMGHQKVMQKILYNEIMKILMK